GREEHQGEEAPAKRQYHQGQQGQQQPGAPVVPGVEGALEGAGLVDIPGGEGGEQVVDVPVIGQQWGKAPAVALGEAPKPGAAEPRHHDGAAAVPGEATVAEGAAAEGDGRPLVAADPENRQAKVREAAQGGVEVFEGLLGEAV